MQHADITLCAITRAMRAVCRGLCTSSGMPTSLTTGFFKMMQPVLAAARPSAMVVAFDEGLAFRCDRMHF